MVTAPSAVSVFDYIIIGVYLVLLTSMGWIFRRFTRGSKDYFAGGHRMTWWLLGATSFVSNFSCWVFTGAANMAYTYGMLIFGFYAIDVFGFLCNYLFTAQRFRQLRLVTSMDAVRLRFGRANEQFFTWLGFISSLGISAVWMVSLSIILTSAFGFPMVPVIVVTGVVVVLIALVGGSWAVAASDFIQLLVILSITFVVSVLTILKVGGVGAFLAQIPETHWTVFHPAGSIPYDWIYIATGVVSVIFMRNNVTVAAKYIAAKDSVHARRSALIPLCGYLVMPAIWFIPPFAAFTLVPDLQTQSIMKIPGEAAYIMVALKVLPQGLVGLLIAGMFSVTISAMDVALNKNAGFFVKNFYQPLLRPHAADRELVVAGELSTVMFGLLVTGGAVAMVTGTSVSLFDAYLYMGAYLTLPLAVPIFLGMVFRRVPSWSAWTTTLFGMLLTGFLYLAVPTPTWKALLEPLLGPGIYHYLVTNKFVATNIVGVPLTCLFFWATSHWHRPEANPAYEKDAKEFFRRMNTPVDFEREVGADNTAEQARVLGAVSCAYGAFITALALIPNGFAGRLAILGCASVMWTVGIGLTLYSRKVRAADAVRPATPAPA